MHDKYHGLMVAIEGKGCAYVGDEFVEATYLQSKMEKMLHPDAQCVCDFLNAQLGCDEYQQGESRQELWSEP